jgi:hypothetical protein
MNAAESTSGISSLIAAMCFLFLQTQGATAQGCSPVPDIKLLSKNCTAALQQKVPVSLYARA